MSDSVLIVFGKNPVAGKVKTRLGLDLGESVAAALYEAFLIDTLHRCRGLNVSVHLYLAPGEDPVSSSIAPFDESQFRQRGEGLGSRMENAFNDSFEAGFRRAVIIGSDHPTLPPSRIEEAFAHLSDEEAVTIGPSDDGGYYLIGLAGPTPALFADMTYSTQHVLEETLARARSAGLRPHLLEPWYDIDTIDDVVKLARDLVKHPQSCPYTRSVLERVGLTENTSSG